MSCGSGNFLFQIKSGVLDWCQRHFSTLNYDGYGQFTPTKVVHVDVITRLSKLTTFRR